MPHAVEAEGLVKKFGQSVAVADVSLTVPEGTVLGVLGPNGAGKTTTVRMLTTLIRPDGGHARVAGADVVKQADEVRRRIGVSGQYAAVDEYLTGFENLDMIGRLYHLGGKASKARAKELLAQFRLEDAANRPAKTYSGGMRRRLDLAGALVARPPVIFLDEPTTGLDPRSRGEMWEVIEELVSGGTSLLLTTQYLEEADRLADSIVVVDGGHVIARGTADDLKNEVGGERLEVHLREKGDVARAREFMARHGSGEVAAPEGGRELVVPVESGTRALVALARDLDEAGIEVADIAVRRPTLDDAFLSLTGHSVAQSEDEADAASEGGEH